MINGYQTVEISPPLQLTSSQFAVVAKYTRIGSQGLGIPTITRYEAQAGQTGLYSKVTSSPGESYIGVSLNKMQDLYTREGSANTNICIKAITTTSLTTSPATQPSTEPTGQYKLGDINGDNRINITDIAILCDYIGLERTFTQTEKERADMNKDGKINITDLVQLIEKSIEEKAA